MFAKSLNDLQLDESGKIGYTYKCMGAGFWALRQENFRDALEAIAFEVMRVNCCKTIGVRMSGQRTGRVTIYNN